MDSYRVQDLINAGQNQMRSQRLAITLCNHSSVPLHLELTL